MYFNSKAMLQVQIRRATAQWKPSKCIYDGVCEYIDDDVITKLINTQVHEVVPYTISIGTKYRQADVEFGRCEECLVNVYIHDRRLRKQRYIVRYWQYE